MLWYKNGLETRLRILLLLAVILFVLTQVHFHSTSPMSPRGFLGALEFMWVICALSMAGSGIRTDSPFRAVKGVHGSMHFTLSLPISRAKLLASRVVFGLLGWMFLIIAGFAIASLFPEVRNQVSLADALRYGFTIFLCGAAAFGISTVFATILCQQWQAFAAMFVIFGAKWVLAANFPASKFDFFRSLGGASPLATHAIPWAAILTSLTVGTLCLAAAFRIEKSRQY